MWKNFTRVRWTALPRVWLTIVITLGFCVCYLFHELGRLSLSLSLDLPVDRKAGQLPPALEHEMEALNFISGYANRTLKDFQLEKGGQPIGIFIVTTERSGSNFLANILKSYPGTFYDHEPDVALTVYTMSEDGIPANCPVVSGKTNVLPIFQQFYNCNFACFTKPDKDTMAKNKTENLTMDFPTRENTRMWQICGNEERLCKNRKFVEKMCRKFPIHLFKLTRLDLGQVTTVLEDSRMEARIVYLVRDPRGTIHSRQKMSRGENWSSWSPNILCPRLVKDQKTALEIQAKYPHKFIVVRYEELAFVPFSVVGKILQFLQLENHPQVQHHLSSHTRDDQGGPTSTFRNSKTRPFQWLQEAKKDFSRVEQLQTVCREAIQAWDYRLLSSSKDIDDDSFNPVKRSRWTVDPLKDHFIDNFSHGV